MKKIFLAKIFLTLAAFYSVSVAWAQQPEAENIQAAIKAARARWVAGDTSVGALTPEERKMRVGFIDPPPTGKRKPLLGIPTTPLPAGLDWRGNGGNFVTGIRNQGSCGSCWAFGSVGGLESRTLIDNHTPGLDLNLSEQVVVSCSGYGSCNGGYLVDNYLVNPGVPIESCYPYTASNGVCANACPNWQQSAYKVSSYSWIVPYGSQQTVDALKYSVATYGPTVVTFAVYADFYWYVSGIYTHVTGVLEGYHAVLLIGYDDVNSCFMVKNSWGTGWGESGFFRIAYTEVVGDSDFGYEALAYGAPLSNPVSTITAPADGATLFAPYTITGTASLGAQKVEVGITPGGGSTTWYQAAGTNSWTYSWTPPTAGSYNIKSRATDLAGNIENPGSGINVTVERGLAVDKDMVNITYTAGSPAATSTINLSSIDTLSYNAASDSPWLTVSPANGLTPNTLTLTINPNTQTPGFIAGYVTISSPLAANSPLAVPVNVVIAPLGTPELPHCNWTVNTQNKSCAACHQSTSTFLPADYRDRLSFCRSCHNGGSAAHSRGLMRCRGHSTMVNVTSGGNRFPTYGNITAAQYNDQPFSQLAPGDKVVCVTCHNPMSKSEDYGRVWEMTITDDSLTYWLEKGGWSRYGGLVPLVYRDTSIWPAGGPEYSQTKKSYLVDPSEYSYNEDAGSITFKQAQASSAYIYVTLDYAYLRASSQDNRLCQDCHLQATHEGANCLSCHSAHNTCNVADIREKVRTPDHLDMDVVFLGYSGAESFADGDANYNGICEVCHTTTKYYRRDGSGFANHSGGANFNAKNCAACHTHSSGFARNGNTPAGMFLQIVSPLPNSTVNGDVAIQVYATLTNGTPVTGQIQVCIDNGAWQDCTLNGYGFWQYLWPTNRSDMGASHTIMAQGTSGSVTGTVGPITVIVDNPDTATPSSAITSPAAGAYLKGASITVTGTASDDTGVQKVEVSTDGGSTWAQASGTTAWSYTWTLPADGPYTIKSRAVDIAGNVETPGSGVAVTVDKTAPVVSAGPDKTAGSMFTQTATAADATAMTYSWTKQSGSGTVTFGSPAALSTTVSASAGGNYTLRFTATDAAGNSAHSDMNLTWDALAPSSSITSPAAGAYLKGASITVTGTASDDTGVQKVEVSTDGGSTWAQASGTTAWGYTWTLPADGQYTVKSRAMDLAANMETPGPGVSVTVDNTPPAISVDHLSYGSTTVNSPGTSLSIKRGTTVTWYVAASDNMALKTTGGVTVVYNNAVPPLSDITSSLSGGFYRYTVTLPISRSQSCTFTFTATDSSGNVANTATYTITTI